MIVIKSLGLNRITLLALALALVSGTARAETLPSAVWAFDLLARVEQWQSVEPLDFLRNVHFAQRWEADGSLVDADAARLQIQAHYRRMPMYFEPNVGQVAADVKFLARGPGYALFLTADEAVLALRPSRSVEEPETAPANSGAVIRTRLEGTTRNPQAHPAGVDPAGVEKLPSVSHYLLGNDPKKWRTNVPHYAQVRYPNVYPGIDLVYYGNPEHLEHDFIVAPGADPSVIRWVISGAQQVRVNLEGDLMLTVPGGEVVQQAPRIYQMIEGQQQWVAGRYVLHDPESAVASTVSVATSTTPALEALQVGFEVAQYDRQQSLVIDPVLVYSTYLGGVKDDYGNGIAVDDDGFAYVTGGTAAIDFPEKLNSFIWTKTHVKQNAFVSKFDFSQSGTDSLVYSTYLDGSDDKDDIGYGVAVESILINGIVNTYTCVTGMTASTDFPLGGGKLAGGKDAFIVCLDKSGGGPVFSTYLGGTKDDEGRGIAMKWPMIYVTGQTNSINFPLTNPFQPALLGGIDAFVSQINALSGTGMPPIYSTYLGGAKDDKGAAIAVDNSGNIYITGSTASTNFPVTGASAFDSTLGGSLDGFIAKIEPGSMGMYSLAYSAYVGGSSTDSGAGVAVDSNSDVYVTGATSSSNFPVTPNAAQANYGGSGDAFIIKVDPLLTGSTSLIYSTYLGGKGADSGASIAVIKRTGTGLIHTYVTGATASTDFPVTSGSNADNTLGGSGDAFIAQISEHGDQWLYVTYLGGDNGVDSGAGITADETSIYVTGATGASDFPVTTMPPSVAFDMVLGSSKDAFVVKLKDFLFTLTILKAGSGTGTVASLPAGIACGSFCSAIYAGTTSTGGTYVTLTATAANGSKFAGWSPPYCGYLFLSKNETCTATFTLNPVPPPSTSSPSSIVLSGNYDGNKTADLIWHHAVSGHTYGMLLNGFAIIDAKMFHYEPDTAWRIVQNGDLDGNGQDDLLWWNNLTGQVWWMPMNGLNIAGGGQIYQEPDTAWQITAVGDLNGDGKDDLVWRHQISGDVYGMLMNGGAIVSQGMFYSEHINWQILAARDFNGDGKADLLWRNNSTGQVWLMPMDGLTIAGGAMIHTAPLAWNIVAVGDFNNDQRNDLIWWNQYTGQVWGMLMNGYLISAQGLFYIEPDTNWRIVSSGDYTGDGNADLLWRHADGRIYEMAMDGLTVIGGQQIYQEANPDWRIVADAETSPLPPPSRSLPGASRFAPLEGEPLNPYQPFDGEPVNPNLLPAQ